MTDRRAAYLAAMDIPMLCQRASAGARQVEPQTSTADTTLSLTPLQTAGWDELAEMVRGCRACSLCEQRTNTVFGVGNRQAKLMLVGEGPGADEDRKGEPFVGVAGQLLNQMLAAIGLQREDVYIANVVKCRPPGNRNPHALEAATCLPFLHRQIELVQPSVLMALGAVAAHNLLHTEESVGQLRREPLVFSAGTGEVPLIVSYHPAYLLRTPADKAKAWVDWQKLVGYIR